MTDHDPRSTFQADQEAAQSQDALRDDVAWQQHVRAQEADLALKTTLERRMAAQAKALEALAALALWIAFALVIMGTAWGVDRIVGAFR